MTLTPKGNTTEMRCVAALGADKFSQADVRINRFVEVSAPSERALLATMPFRQRRSFVREERVQHILRVLDAAPGAHDTSGLVLTDPALAAVGEFNMECAFVWRRPPSATVRSAILWRMVQESLPARGKGYSTRLRVPRSLGASTESIAAAMLNHVEPVRQKSDSDRSRQFV